MIQKLKNWYLMWNFDSNPRRYGYAVDVNPDAIDHQHLILEWERTYRPILTPEVCAFINEHGGIWRLHHFEPLNRWMYHIYFPYEIHALQFKLTFL